MDSILIATGIALQFALAYYLEWIGALKLARKTVRRCLSPKVPFPPDRPRRAVAFPAPTFVLKLTLDHFGGRIDQQHLRDRARPQRGQPPAADADHLS